MCYTRYSTTHTLHTLHHTNTCATPQCDLAAEAYGDLVEYCHGDNTTKWGRQRGLDGHPDIYNVTHFELGNEQVSAKPIRYPTCKTHTIPDFRLCCLYSAALRCLHFDVCTWARTDQYNANFASQVAAMEGRAKQIGMPPRSLYVQCYNRYTLHPLLYTDTLIHGYTDTLTPYTRAHSTLVTHTLRTPTYLPFPCASTAATTSGRRDRATLRGGAALHLLLPMLQLSMHCILGITSWRIYTGRCVVVDISGGYQWCVVVVCISGV
jgi:hypothetical protein